METIAKSLEELVVFHAVATHSSFTKAALTLGASKAVLSKRLSGLEKSIGIQLFQRTTRSVSLTDEGRLLFSYSERILSLADEVGRRLRFMKEGESGTLRISMPPMFGNFFIPQVEPLLREALPDLEMEFDLSMAQRDLARDGIDFAFRASTVREPEIIVKSLGRFRDVICASPHYLKQMNAPFDLQSLNRFHLLAHSSHKLWNQWIIKSGGHETRLEANGAPRTNSYDAMHLLCTEGRGVARLPRYVVLADLKSGRLIELQDDYEIATHPVFLIYLRDEFLTNKKKLAKEVLVKWLSQQTHLFLKMN